KPQGGCGFRYALAGQGGWGEPASAGRSRWRSRKAACVPATVTPAVFVITAAHAAMRPQHACKCHEAVFLIIIEALIKRRGRIRDLFQGGACFGQAVGALGEPVEWRN